MDPLRPFPHIDDATDGDDSLVDFAEQVTKVAREVRPSMYFRITSKEKVLQYIETPPLVRHGWHWWRRSSVPVLSFAGALALLLLVLFPPMGHTPAVEASQVAQVTIDFGSVWVRRDNQLVEVFSGDQLFVGDEIIVDGDAQASLLFIDSSIAVLQEHSSILITGVLINPVDHRHSQVEVMLQSGSLLADTGRELAKEGASFRVRTTSGVVETGQAQFLLTILEDGTAEVTALSHTIQVSSNEDGSTPMVMREEGGNVTGTAALAVITAEETPISGTGSLAVVTSLEEFIVVNTEHPGTVLAVEPKWSREQVSSLRSQLYFAEIKLEQAHNAFVAEDIPGSLEALRDYTERLHQIYGTYLGASYTLESGSNIAGLLEQRRGGQLLIEVREHEVEENALPQYREALMYLRRMVALEAQMRQEVAQYAPRPQVAVLSDALMQRVTREVYPIVDEMVTLEKERHGSSLGVRHPHTVVIEQHTATITNVIMGQSDPQVRSLLLEEILSVMPDNSTYQYMILRLKVYLPAELHGLVDRKVRGM